MRKGKPELDDGYFRLSNEFYDALYVFRLKPTQHIVFGVLVKKIWGWGKKEDDISLSQLSIMTRLSESHISLALNSLESLNLISKKRSRYGQLISINKYYKTWVGWDESWEYWNKDGESEPVSEKQPKQEQQIELTKEQTNCWEWAKLQDYWQDKVSTQADFLKLYLRHNSGVKTQYEAFMGKSKQRMSRIEEKNTRSQRIKRKSFIHDATGNGDFLEGECEVVND